MTNPTYQDTLGILDYLGGRFDQNPKDYEHCTDFNLEVRTKEFLYEKYSNLFNDQVQTARTSRKTKTKKTGHPREN